MERWANTKRKRIVKAYLYFVLKKCVAKGCEVSLKKKSKCVVTRDKVQTVVNQ